MYLMLSYLDSNFSECSDARPRDTRLFRVWVKREPLLDEGKDYLRSRTFFSVAVSWDATAPWDPTIELEVGSAFAVSDSIMLNE